MESQPNTTKNLYKLQPNQRLPLRYHKPLWQRFKPLLPYSNARLIRFPTHFLHRLKLYRRFPTVQRRQLNNNPHKKKKEIIHRPDKAKNSLNRLNLRHKKQERKNQNKPNKPDNRHSFRSSRRKSQDNKQNNLLSNNKSKNQSRNNVVHQKHPLLYSRLQLWHRS